MESVTYIVDTDLIRFAKFAIAILGMFIVVGISLFGFNLKDMAKQLSDGHQSLKNTHVKLDAAQHKMDMGLQHLQASFEQIKKLQLETELVKERAEKALLAITHTERRSKEILIAMQTVEGVGVVKTIQSEETIPDEVRQGKLWPNGISLKVAFMGGTEDIQNLVREAASEWTEYANIQFDFNSSTDDAQIRTAFERGGFCWSYIGRDARDIPPSQATMNIDPTWPKDALYGTILREFGFAIGLMKEHQNPNARIPWDKDQVYDTLGSAPNFWDNEKIDHDIFASWPEGYFQFQKEYDQYSIMHDSIPNNWTIEDFETIPPTTLSEGDKEWVSTLYPK